MSLGTMVNVQTQRVLFTIYALLKKHFLYLAKPSSPRCFYTLTYYGT